MKRLIPIFLVLLLLCGCGSDPVQTAPTETLPPVTSAPTEPTGYYDPQSSLEADTDGAVRCYPLARTDCQGFAVMGEDLLIFSGSEFTTITKLSGSSLYISAVANLDCSVYADDTSTLVSEKGVVYYDEFHRALVYLDTALKEVSRTPVPEDMTGRPVISADRKKLFYCTDGALRCLELDTGLNRLLREMRYSYQVVSQLHCNDTVLQCGFEDDYGNWHTLFISTENGETLYDTQNDLTLWTSGSTYLAVNAVGDYREYLTGCDAASPSVLLIDGYQSNVYPVPKMCGAVTIDYSDTDDPTVLNYYDLSCGTRSATLGLPARYSPWNLKPAGDGSSLWLMLYDAEQETDVICRWDLTKTPANDTAVYLDVRHTAESPDLDGLSACAAEAADLSAQYGVDIRIWMDATACQPWDFSLDTEYRVPVIRYRLAQLAQALSNYPDGFLKEAAESTTSGVIHICLVHAITGNPDADVITDAIGLQYWDDSGDAYLALALGESINSTFYHEMFHIIDSRVLCGSTAYDDWEALNPPGFEYDYDYVTNASREDYNLTNGEQQAFIDTYSMSFPKEDRARIMEYAMMPDNTYCFQSPTMQAKLRQLCLGIREAFELENTQEPLLWEQYLNEPLFP